MVTSSLSSSDQCKQKLLIFNQLERLEAEQPEEAHEGARQGRGLVRGGQQRGEVSTVQYSTVQYINLLLEMSSIFCMRPFVLGSDSSKVQTVTG